MPSIADLPDEIKLRILSFSRIDSATNLAGTVRLDYNNLMEELRDYDPSFTPGSLLYALKRRRLVRDNLIGSDSSLLYQWGLEEELIIDLLPSTGVYTVSGAPPYMISSLDIISMRRVGPYIEFKHSDRRLVEKIDVLYKCSRTPLSSLEDDLVPRNRSWNLSLGRVIHREELRGDWDELIELWGSSTVSQVLTQLLTIARSRRSVLEHLKKTPVYSLYPYIDRMDVYVFRGRTLIEVDPEINSIGILPSSTRLGNKLEIRDGGNLARAISLLSQVSRPLVDTLLADTFSFNSELHLLRGVVRESGLG
jgi:hypothetical protein